MHCMTDASHYALQAQMAECGKTIRGKNHYKRHRLEVHDIDSRFNLQKTSVMVYQHKCDECDFSTKRKYLLDYHKQRKHSQDFYIFKCDNCNKTLNYRSNLNRHKKSCHKDPTKEVSKDTTKAVEEAASCKGS